MTHTGSRFAAAWLGACVLIFGIVFEATGAPYLTSDAVPLLMLLPPPPAKDSDITAKELAEVLTIQANRSEAQAAHAIADANEETAIRFFAGMNIAVEAAKIPLTIALVNRLGETESAITDGVKRSFNRPRPAFVNADIKPIARLSKSGSYPSGHTTFGTLTGIVLAVMLPEKRDAIFARVRDYANSRLVVGAHYRSDLDAGFLSGTAIAAVLFNDAAFKKDLEPAKVEIRTALGL